MIAREALTNVRKHARASSVEVELEYARDRFRLSIRDDGCGMDLGAMDREPGREHFGITGMRERSRQLEAEIAIFSREATGTDGTLGTSRSGLYTRRLGEAPGATA